MPPSASPSIWWPRQMPNTGSPDATQLLDLRAPRIRRWRPDRPGRWRGTRHRVCAPGSHAALVVAGTTVTLQPSRRQAAQDVALEAIVDGHHVQIRRLLPTIALAPGPARLVPGVALAGASPPAPGRAPAAPAEALASALSCAEIDDLPGGSWRDDAVGHALARGCGR